MNCRIFLSFGIIILVSCTNRKSGKANEVIFDSSRLPTIVDSIKYNGILTYNDTAYLPYQTEDTFGFFKGLISVPFMDYEITVDQNDLSKFIENNFSKKALKVLNTKTLSHSVSINLKRKLRVDFYRLGKIHIESTYYFENRRFQRIAINGKPAAFWQDKTDSTYDIDAIEIEPHSFRDYTFKGHEFYYMEATYFDKGGTASLNNFQIFYSVEHNSFSLLSDFRVSYQKIFGDADGDNQLDVLNIDNEGGYGIDSINNFRASLYSWDRNGKLQIRKNKKGREYFVAGNSGGNYYTDNAVIDSLYWLK